MKTIRRLLVGLISIILGLSILLGVLGFFTVRRSFPITNGEIHLSGLNGPVDIYRDGYGIPHIYASTLHDVFFAQGYVHAQDRFWQMDFWRHIGSGRLSEMFGQSQLDTDKFLRAMGWARVAQQELDSLDPTSVSILNDYAEGVNAYLADHKGSALSLEYAVLKLLNASYQPEPWTPLHSLTWAKAMAWDLRGNMEEEIARANLLKNLTPQQVDELYPPYPADNPVILPDFKLSSQGNQANAGLETSISSFYSNDQQGIQAALDGLHQRFTSLDALLGPAGAGIGSNNWVISGKLTATGKPLLANDPHLGIQMPSIWYEIGLHCAPKNTDCNLDVTGFSFASAPGVTIGHNDRIAWGFTNVGPDVIDLYIEKINPDNPDQYEVNGQWVDMTLVNETIQVSGGQPVPITVRYTRHGPLIWDNPKQMQEVQDKWGLELPEKFAIALRWTALEPSHTFPAIWKFDIASNWDEFRAGAAEFDVPAQNLVYADVDGNIGYQTPGKIPVRSSGDGRLPVPGWTDQYEWTGYIPFEELPYAFNPPQGFIATANNAVVGAEYPYLITNDWSYGYRARRIVEMIQNAPSPIDIAYFQQMQGDDKDLNAERLMPILLQIPLTGTRLEKARSILQGWDYQDRMDSAPAALFNAFWRHLLSLTFNDDILNQDYWPTGGDRWFEVVRGLVKDPGSPWWDIQSTPQVETMNGIFSQALSAAVDEMEKLQGKDPSRWRWGDLHTATFRNATLGESGIAPIEALFNRGPFPTAGGDSIVNATGWSTLEPYSVVWLPSMRMIVDFSNLQNSLTVNTTGQSGHAYHRHYIDLVDLWRNIQYHSMLWERAQVEAHAEGHLKLLP
jgi:penicillin amidase